jgi:hypothetical protein
MTAPNKNYSQADLESVKRHLADILTVPLEASELARQHPSEVTRLAIIFAAAKDRLHQNWAEALLTKVPLSSWEEPSEYAFRIAPTKAASMRFLLRGEPTEDALKLKDNRRALLNDLLENMDGPKRLAYRPMLEWVDIRTAWPEAGALELASDTAFGHSMEVIEGLLRDQVHIYEQNFRKEWKTPPAVPTPMAVQLEASEMAAHAIAAQIEQFCLTASDVTEVVKDNLLARVSANISVNRTLLEKAAIDARGQEAAAMCIPFLQRLNLHGMLHVPLDLQHDFDDGGESEIREKFTQMFAAGGLLGPVDDYFKRHMTESDIEMVVRSWSKQLQESYISSRGIYGCREEHGLPAHRFIFALAVAAAFYETSQTTREFTGHSRPTYAVFPDRGDTAKGLRSEPSVHAAEIFMQAYGQMYYSNDDGWALLADKVAAYAKMRSAKRSHIQQLLYFAVKNRNSRQLFALFQHLETMMLKRAPKQ